ncbi:aldolase/citrate lyase family protein [Dankookia sp. P2]|uniref:aldolase/citrate lyase family protein n=1 Tax=Dankookia sp. P2 TaxID=3423955 RepID=UPI003D67CAAA
MWTRPRKPGRSRPPTASRRSAPGVGAARPSRTTCCRRPTPRRRPKLNEAILVCVMIETPEAVEAADSIAAVPGIDALMIGTSDLTASMGISGQIGHPRVKAAYESVANACKRHGKTLGMGGVYDEVHASTYIGLGARFLLSGNDQSFLMAGASARAKFLRGLQPAG